MGRPLRILVGAYREWARELVRRARRDLWDMEFEVTGIPEGLAKLWRDCETPDAAVFIGWSWIVPQDIVNAVPCVCLHPSMLPAYRGGSPLQHQILAGETHGGVTLFRMTDEIDAGPIYKQEPMSLDGTLTDIFQRIVDIGAPMLAETLRELSVGKATMTSQQQELLGTVYRRRQPHESEITLEALANMNPRDAYNFIRATAHPDYPPAFIKYPDGSRLELTGARLKLP